MAVNEFKLPDVGEGLTEAEIVTWMVQVGDTIKVNDIICEIETAKSLVELPSPYAGTVAELKVAAGQTVEVGTPIISVSSGASTGTSASAPSASMAAERAVEEETAIEKPAADQAVEPGLIGNPAPLADGATPTLVGYGPRTVETRRRPRKSTGSVSAPPAAGSGAPAVSAPSPASAPPPTATTAPAAPSNGARMLAKPPVRKLAKDLGIELALVTPTGPGGTISRSDVEAFAGGDQTETGVVDAGLVGAAAVAPVRAGERETRIAVKGVRKMMSQAMVASAFTAPHVTEWMTVDATKTVKMVARLRADRAFQDVKVSPLLLVARAVCLAVRRTPEVNSTWDEAAQEIVLKNYVNLGIAAATPRGLVVPNIKDADSLSALDLAKALGELTTTARAGRTQPADMAGGTFTITNVGMFGVDGGTPILNPGEAGILCMGAIRKQPWVVGDKIKPRWTITLSLSFDHRIVDGEQGSRFLSDVAAIVEGPGNAILF